MLPTPNNYTPSYKSEEVPMRNAVFTCLLLLLIFPASTLADSIINGGFETGNLNGWTSIGDVAVIGSFSTSTIEGVPLTFAPTMGQFQAVISNGPADTVGRPGGSCTRTPLSCFTFSGNSSVPAGVIASALGMP